MQSKEMIAASSGGVRGMPSRVPFAECFETGQLNYRSPRRSGTWVGSERPDLRDQQQAYCKEDQHQRQADLYVVCEQIAAG